MYVFLLQKIIQREHKRFEEQLSNPAQLWKYVVTWILYAGIQVVVGFFAVHPRAVGDSLEKSVICSGADVRVSYTENPPNCVGGIRELFIAY